MSGLEIAGLVVGAFPLVVSALQHYHEAHKALFRVETEYRRILEDVKDEQLVFRLVLEQLLSPLCSGENFSEGEVEELLADPSGSKWDQTEVATFASERLGRTHDRFMEIAKSMQQSLSKLLASLIDNKPQLQERLKLKLQLTSTGTPTSKSKLSMSALQDCVKKKLQYRKQQLELGAGKLFREEVLKDIHRNNKKLDKLLEKSDKISTLQVAKTTPISPVAVKSLLHYWEHADQIHALMSRSWQCKCRDRHCAHLWLQHRKSPVFEMELLVVFASATKDPAELPPWDRQGIRITWQEGGVQNPGVLPSAKVHIKKAAKIAEQPAPAPAKRRKVDFMGVEFSVQKSIARQLPPPSPSSLACKTSAATNHCGAPLPLRDISKLCEAMAACGMQSTLLGSFTSQHIDKVYSVRSDPGQKVAGEALSLPDILQGVNVSRPKRSDRFRIALAIASSHLQLRSTSWARRQWEASDIYFPMDGNGQMLYEKPYVSATFAENLPTAEKVPKRSDRSFSCLGIMLLELLFGTRLEDHELWEQLGFAENKTSAFHRLLVARQWADAADNEGGPSFSAAIMWCLNESPATLTGNAWRKALADRVVLPLERCYDWIMGLP